MQVCVRNFRSARFFEVHCHDGIQLYKRVLGMILEPFYTENNWTTKNQVLAYQKHFEMQTLTEKYYQEKILFCVNVTNF